MRVLFDTDVLLDVLLDRRPHADHAAALLSLVDVAPVNRQVLDGALRRGFGDFEDAVAHEAARLVQADAIVSRNLRDFKASIIPVHSPADLLSLLQAGKGKSQT